MTTRVQKGGPIFKPVVKSRVRPSNSAPRQSSSTPAPSGSNDGPSLPSTSSLMPPPTIVPVRTTHPEKSIPSLDHSSTPSSSSTAIDLNTQPPSSAAPDTENGISSRPFVPTHRPMSTLSSNTAAPIIIAQRKPMPIVVSRQAPPPITSTPLNPPIPPSEPSEPSATVPRSQLDTSPPIPEERNEAVDQEATDQILPPIPSGSSGPKVALNTEGAVKKPRRAPARKKTVPAVGEVPTGEGAAPTDQPEDTSVQKKPKRTRKKKAPEGTDDAPLVKKRAKRKVVVSESETEEGTEEPPTKKRKRKASSAPRGPRKKRGASQTPFDPDADPGEEIDPTVITMASLCSDSGRGRVSSKAALIQSNHAAWKAANKEKRARMRLLMEQKKYGIDENAEETSTNANAAVIEESTSTAPVVGPSSAPGSTRGSPGVEDESGHGFDYSQSLATSRFNVQVRIGPNGETIIDEESLFVDRGDEADETENYTHVVESDTTKFVNSGTYGKKFRGTRWSAEETERFYEVLSQFGENYELIAYMLPGRDRKSCKNKFKAEDRKDPARINYCLKNKTPVDIDALSQMTGKDFSGPTPQIRAPTPLTMTEAEPESTPQTRASTTPGPVRKRSRSRTSNSALNEGVQIIGNADTFEQNFDD